MAQIIFFRAQAADPPAGGEGCEHGKNVIKLNKK